MPSDSQRQLVELARQGDRAVRRVAAVETLLQQLAETVEQMAAQHGAAAAAAEPMPCWLAAEDPDAAVDELAALVGWLDTVYLRYAGAALPSCWLWHPDVVAELQWLRGAHRDAYSGAQGGWSRVGDWHDRYRPGVVARVRSAVGSCELALHEHEPPPSTAALASAATATALAWTHARTRPTPTEQQLSEARQYDRDQTTRSRR